MPRFRPHFSLRWLMILVAVVAASLGGVLKTREWGRLAKIYRTKAQEHADIETTLRDLVARSGEDSPVDISVQPNRPSIRFPIRKVIEHEGGLKRKYERAAARPWQSVPADTLLPE